jgi:exopolysaccharide biosynthesis polyprenyl glycosylphosphotransferase
LRPDAIRVHGPLPAFRIGSGDHVALPSPRSPKPSGAATTADASIGLDPSPRPSAGPAIVAPRGPVASVQALASNSSIERSVICLIDVIATVVVSVAFGRWSMTAVLLVAVLHLAVLASDTYRRPRVTLSALSELPQILTRCAIPLLFVALDATFQQVDRWVFQFVVALTVGVAVGRFVSFALLRSLRRRGITSHPTLIFGAGAIGNRIAERLRLHPEFGLSPIGVVDDSRIEDTVLMGSAQDLVPLLEETGATRLILAFGATSDMTLIEFLRRVPTLVEVFIVPRLFELGSASGDPMQDDLWDTPLVWMRRRGSRTELLRAKRVFDVVVASVLVVVTAPILAACALAVRLTSRGPILFRQERIGRYGEAFNLLKFRSMRVNDDSDTQWNVRSDDRVTPVGRVLRRTSLDELPQLFNVLSGDMSLVGPRPERPHFVEQFGRTVPHYEARHRSPVGLTGWAQVNGLRGDTSIEERVRFDNHYIEHWSMWRDLVILARTARAAMRGG